MIELNSTGYMSNKGRQIVASFLVNYLNIDWRLGADYFESVLIDHDFASNDGNWNYIASIEFKRDNSFFNLFKQTYLYDRECKFIKRWIPSLCDETPENIINVNLPKYCKPIYCEGSNKHIGSKEDNGTL